MAYEFSHLTFEKNPIHFSFPPSPPHPPTMYVTIIESVELVYSRVIEFHLKWIMVSYGASKWYLLVFVFSTLVVELRCLPEANNPSKFYAVSTMLNHFESSTVYAASRVEKYSDSLGLGRIRTRSRQIFSRYRFEYIFLKDHFLVIAGTRLFYANSGYWLISTPCRRVMWVIRARTYTVRYILARPILAAYTSTFFSFYFRFSSKRKKFRSVAKLLIFERAG